MRIGVLGAGATGGYFGGRLLEAGRDVTFIVRPKRAAELDRDGLVIRSQFGDAVIPAPATSMANTASDPFDLILLSCKAYDLASAMDAIEPVVGPDTLILPLLNGMQHLDMLDARFGRARVLGGQCVIAATLNDKREIVHLNAVHGLTFGDRDHPASDRMTRVDAQLQNAGFNVTRSDDVIQAMWEKWMFLATIAGMTCLMRAAIGDILAAPRGRDIMLAMFEECQEIARDAGYPPREAFLAQALPTLTNESSTLTASMLRDLESNARTEADAIIGDLIDRRTSRPDNQISMLDVAFAHLKSRDTRLAREMP